MTTLLIKEKDYRIEYEIFDYNGVKFFGIVWFHLKNREDYERINKRYEKDLDVRASLYSGTLNHRTDFKYIKHIKKFLKWEKGQIIYLFSKYNADGCYYFYQGDEIKKDRADFCIDEDGFLRAKLLDVDKYWGQVDFESEFRRQDIWWRLNCKYNDEVIKSIKKK